MTNFANPIYRIIGYINEKKAPFCYLKQGGVFYGYVPGLSPEHIAIGEVVIIDE